MKFIFCSDSLDRQKPDEAYEAEVAVVEGLGAEHFLFNFEVLTDEGDAAKAVRRVPEQSPPDLAIYRGWMLKPLRYQRLYEALDAKGLRLINNPAAYRHCHHLPESYPVIEQRTPRSVWVKFDGAVEMDRIVELLRPFGAAPLVLKDFVKSRKHEWDEACFIPSAADRTSVERVVRRFLELVDDDLNEGLVFREFVEFEALNGAFQERDAADKGVPTVLPRRQADLLDRVLGGGRLRWTSAACRSVHRCRRRREEPFLHNGRCQAAGWGLDDRGAWRRPSGRYS